MIALDQLTLASFLPLVGELFEVLVGPGRNAPAELICVTPSKAQSTNPTHRQSFSLLFRVAGFGVLPQGIYRLSNAQFGEAEIFLVPVGFDQRGVQLEAVFN